MNTIVKGIRGRLKQELVEFDVDIEINVRKLAEVLGRKALANKSRKSREVDGLIIVTVRAEPQRVAGQLV